MIPPSKDGGGKAEDHYKLFDNFGQVEQFEIPPMADESFLFLWCPQRYITQGFNVLAAWGFRRAAERVWVKMGKNGLPSFGMGTWTRSSHEMILVGRRGSPKHARNMRSVLIALRREHSQKPEKLQDEIEVWTAGPYAELFARRDRPGWDCYGDELLR